MAAPAVAQVTVDLRALQALPQRAAPSPSPMPRYAAPQPRPMPPVEPGAARGSVATTAPPTVLNPAAPGATTPGTTPSATPPSSTQPAARPALPESTPAIASIPPVPPPAEAAAPPPPPPISDQAATKAEPVSQGLRLLFATGQSDLSPDSAASLKQLTSSLPPGDATSFSVSAYAPGSRDDPSSARRLSLARAMAVRSALVSSGVASTRIYVRALGEAYGSGPADRVDVAVQGLGDSTAQAAPK
ncbi:MAG: OmpA family protein [Acetobacteraceae bacterium]|nr:OmpA family protein [Pseudomonadota bacterium]